MIPPTAQPDSLAPRRRRDFIIAAAVAILCVAGAEVALRHSKMGRSLHVESRYTRKPLAFDEGPGADILFTGDSRVLHGIDPDAVAASVRALRGEDLRVFNGGLSGAPPMAQLAWIRRALTHDRRRPRLVVMGLSPYMFSSRIVKALSRESLTTIYRVRDLPALVRAGASLDDLALAAASATFDAVRFRPRVLSIVLKGAPLGVDIGGPPNGWVALSPVPPAVQAERGRGRAIGYRVEMWPPATFGSEQNGYFTEALRQLRAAGVAAVVLSSASASQLELAYGPTSIYDQHIAWVKAETAKHGAVFADVRSNPAVSDADFIDGDHMNGAGASRYSSWLTQTVLVPALGGRRDKRDARCKPLFTFDEGARALSEWTVEGTNAALVVPASPAGQQPVIGFEGAGFVDTFGPAGDRDTTGALSPEFTVPPGLPHLKLRVAGGQGADVGVTLEIEGHPVFTARGANSETFTDLTWDVRAHAEKKARVRVFDRATGAWGHVMVDAIAACP